MGFWLLGINVGMALMTMTPFLPGSNVLLWLLAWSWLKRQWTWLFGLAIGLMVAGSMLQAQLAAWLPESLQQQDLLVEGYLIDEPRLAAEGLWHLQMGVQRCQINHQVCELSGRIRLSWYNREQPWQHNTGACWRVQVRLKRPRGLLNPGGRDSAKYLLSASVNAVGYVRDWQGECGEDAGTAPLWQRLAAPVQLWRRSIAHDVRQVVAAPTSALLVGLVVGDRRYLSEEQWQWLRQTGMVHLFVISGLHIGMLAGLGYGLGLGLFWLLSLAFPALLLWRPAVFYGACVAVVFATGYALLAGASLPTQRAWMMVIAVMWASIIGIRCHIWMRLGWALLLVQLLQPMAIHQVGFWLSFVAVAALLWLVGLPSMTAITKQQNHVQNGIWSARIWPYLRPLLVSQWIIFLVLAPILLAQFAELSLWSPLANLLAIPWVTWFVVPMALLGASLIGCWPSLANLLLTASALGLDSLIGIIDTVGNMLRWPTLQVQPFELLPMHWLFFGLALILWGCCRVLAGRLLPFLLLLPLFFNRPESPEYGDFNITVFDVGQGLALAVETRNHLLLYDAGPSWLSGQSAGSRYLVPWLTRRATDSIDLLVVSHGDLDHAGGVASIVEWQRPSAIMSGDWVRGKSSADVCRLGDQWHWDGVTFRVLHDGFNERKDNNRSCVILIDNGHQQALLTGDIEHSVEQQLLVSGELSAVDWLLVPHHGSRSSSSVAWLQRLQPQWAVVSAGYLNRFRHPASEVVARYQSLGIELLNTAEMGAMEFGFRQKGGIAWRAMRCQQRFWSLSPAVCHK